ncbi:rhomboid family intramembrane serine protease [Streptacidiphilus neutrinimicus]|uniref:rhomboid family intramembrane serine protease n=1 Tax=Streptacidiphilus neutrinimicus TaxID=105420 RepID=UPI0005A6A2BE|nr:rhomboid family intramembrane serine protease [Streptacidiphilus neutrinimicus]
MAERPLWAPQELDTPEKMIAEARKAFFVMFAFLVVIWALQILNWVDSQRLSFEYGVIPHDVGRLQDIFAAPFLHFSWAHIESNSGPLFVFGFLAAYRGVVRFLWLTLLVTVTSGLAVWFFQGGDTVGVGASGVIFGYFGYVVLRGIFDRHLIDTLIGLVMAASFAYLVTIVVPGTPGVSWLAHLGGLVGGVAGAWLLRDRRPKAVASAGGASVGGAPAVAGPGLSASPGGQPALPGDRADLHKELGDLGLL